MRDVSTFELAATVFASGFWLGFGICGMLFSLNRRRAGKS